MSATQAAVPSNVVDLVANSTPTNRDYTPPDPTRLIFALRQIGYNLEQALADLLDNSIAAKADSILIRFICDHQSIRSLAIVDNGHGMSGNELSEAMRFGSSRDRSLSSLGKFGMGLKLASLSHARSLSVLTRHDGRPYGRRWTLDGINAGWECDVLSQKEVESTLQRRWGPIDLSRNGTLVVWDDIDRFSQSPGGLRASLRTLQKKIEVHLGLAFHRYLEKGKVRIWLDQQIVGTPEHGIRVTLKPLNPFGYPESGRPDYPKMFPVSIEGIGTIETEAHIWPPNSELPAYKLGHKAASRQGFYFYRNDRLIQTGGWNGVVQNDSEPHSSLARVRVDLPPELDEEFGLNIQKSAVVVPTGFEKAIAQAVSEDGACFDAFRQDAQLVYRKQDKKGYKLLPAVPGNGIPRELAKSAIASIAKETDAVRTVDFRWDELSDEQVFSIDRKEGVLILNRQYRARLRWAHGDGQEDLPVFKTLLFLLLKDEFINDRVSAARKNHLINVNSLLRRAILSEK